MSTESNVPARVNDPFIYIIESPAPADLFDGRTEGRVLCEALRLAGIRTWYRLAVNLAMFDLCFGAELATAMTTFQALPILHLSTHGNDNGVQLTDGTFVSWDGLRKRLVPLNQTLSNALIVSMSSCFGAAGCQMAMEENAPLPYHALIGHTGSATWSDAAVAFVALYHRLFKGASVEDAITAMREASGDASFHIVYGQKIQHRWAEHVRNQRMEALRALSALIEKQNPTAGTAPVTTNTLPAVGGV